MNEMKERLNVDYCVRYTRPHERIVQQLDARTNLALTAKEKFSKIVQEITDEELKNEIEFLKFVNDLLLGLKSQVSRRSS